MINSFSKKKKPIVSVILPVYNVELYLKECLDSIMGQTLSDIEVICVNDGSTDDSYRILEEYARKDKRISIYTKENEGIGGAAARNYGLDRASGKYVSILDSDDFFAPCMLEKMVQKADITNADIVVCGGYEYDDKTHAFWNSKGILDEEFIPDKDVFSFVDCSETIFQLSAGMAWNKLYRRSFLKEHELRFQKIKYSDDAYFTFSNMVLANRIAIVNEKLVNYRVNSGRNQTNGISDYPDSSYVPYIEIKKLLEERKLYKTIERSFINCAVGFMKYCYEKIDRYDAFIYLHNRFREEVFEQLGLFNYKDDFFYDKRVAMWIHEIMNYTAEELLFMSARAHGSTDSTTGILRFRFPYEVIPVNSRLVIIGDRIVGRHYMSQAYLSGNYDVILWVDEDNPRRFNCVKDFKTLEKTDFDFVLISYCIREKINETVSNLRSLGVAEEKIIIGEDYL